MLQAGRSRVLFPMRSLIFSLYLLLPATIDPVADSVSNRNEYHKIFPESRTRSARKANNFTVTCEPIV
jgi:hypothetical protein